MSDVSAILSLPYIQPSQAQKHVTHNEALRILDAVVQLSVLADDIAAPPAVAQDGARYVVPPGSSGEWAGHEGRIALRDNGGWTFLTPWAGWRAYVSSTGQDIVHDGTAWRSEAEMMREAALLGVNAAPDAGNRLSVSSPATLFSHEGAGHQLKINKAATGDTASLLFQTGWSGRAEMGLAGNDAFAIKVSPDGTSWESALTADPVTARLGIPAGAEIDGTVTGTAIQQTAEDISAGRLARADFVYGPGNLIGPVSQSGGVPSGAVIERGANANGDYLRMADGTQVCTFKLRVNFSNATSLKRDWTYPAAFVSQPSLQMTLDIDSFYANASPGLNAVSLTGFSSETVTGARANIFAASGSSFASGDFSDAWVMATGRWY